MLAVVGRRLSGGRPRHLGCGHLPFVFARSLVKDVLLALNKQHPVLQGALPVRLSELLGEETGNEMNLPLVLDPLDLVVHAQHDVT